MAKRKDDRFKFKLGQVVQFNGTRGPNGHMLAAHEGGPDTFRAIVASYPYGLCYGLRWMDGTPVGLPFAESALTPCCRVCMKPCPPGYSVTCGDSHCQEAACRG